MGRSRCSDIRQSGLASLCHCAWTVCLWELTISFCRGEQGRLWEHHSSAHKSPVRSHGDNKCKAWNATYPSTGVPGRCLQHSAERQRVTRKELQRLTVEEHRLCNSCWLCIKILNKKTPLLLGFSIPSETLLKEGPWICKSAAWVPSY